MKTLTLHSTIAFLLGLFIIMVALSTFAADRNVWLSTWEGQYKPNFIDTTLVVEKIDGDKAYIVYKWGGSDAGEGNFEAKFLDDKTLQFEMPHRSGVGIWATVTYVMQDDGTLAAKYSNRHGNFYATLKKK